MKTYVRSNPRYAVWLYKLSTGAIQTMALLIIVFLPGQAYSDSIASCNAKYMCVSAEETDSDVIFSFESFTDTPFTVAFNSYQVGMGPSQESFHFISKQVSASKVFSRYRVPKMGDWDYRWQYFSHIGTETAVHEEAYVYRIPLKSGTNVQVLQGYNSRFTHNGPQKFAIDFDVPVGTEVLAAREGVVIGVRNDSSVTGTDLSARAQENFVWIKQSDGTVAQYLHFQKNGVVVSVGQTIAKGQLLGLSGCTGLCTKPHLHFHVSTPLQKKEDRNFEAFKTFPTYFETTKGVEYLSQGGRYGVP